MKNTNNVVGNFVNPEEENEMKNTNNNANNFVNGLWEEITIDQKLSLEEQISQLKQISQSTGEELMCFDETGIDNPISIMSDEEWNQWVKENRKEDLERIKTERELEKRLEESYKKLEEINKRKEEHNMTLKSFEESITLAQQRQVPDEQILKNKADIDNYFMSVDADTKDNPEEEIRMNRNVKNTTEAQVNPEEETTMKTKGKLEKLKDTVVSKVSEVYREENNPRAYDLVDKANSIISSDLNLETYKEAVITLTEIETALKETKSYTVKLSLEDVQSRLNNLTNYYEVSAKASSTGTYEERKLSSRESFVQGFVDLKDIGVELASKAKASIDSIDEDNKYHQKGVEVTKKAKEKYNKVLDNVFNRLKL